MGILYATIETIREVSFQENDIICFCGALKEEEEAKVLQECQIAPIVTFVVRGKEQGFYHPVSRGVEHAENDGFAVRAEGLRTVGFPNASFGSCAATEWICRCKEKGYSAIKCPEIVVDSKGTVPRYQQIVDACLYKMTRGNAGQRRDGWMFLLRTLAHPSSYGSRRGKQLGYLAARIPMLLRSIFNNNEDPLPASDEDKAFVGLGIYPEDQGVVELYPKVSLLLRTRNNEVLCRRCLESICNQTYPNVEVVVVEDGSSCCEGWIETAFPQLDLHYTKTEENVGRGAALNLAMSKATGDYFNIIDEDDYLMPEHLTLAVSQAGKKNWSMLFCDSLALHEDGHLERVSFANINPYEMSVRCTAASCGVLFSKQLVEKYGPTLPELWADEDWYLWLKYMKDSNYGVSRYASSVFTVPDQTSNALREERYRQYDEILFSREELSFCVDSDTIQRWLENTQNGFDFLRSHHLLEEHLNREAAAIKDPDRARELFSQVSKEERTQWTFTAKDLRLLYQGAVLNGVSTINNH